MKTDEAHIIEQIRRGDTSRYEYFLNAYGQQVFALIVRIVGNREDAEELVQDTFLKAFRHLDSFKGASSFSTWIYRIAYTTAISAIRRRRCEVLSLDDAMLAGVPDEQVDNVLADDSDDAVARLTAALKRLEASERALVTLFYEEERSIAEVAQIMELTEGNTKVKLHRIRKKLYVLMKQEL